MTRCIAWRVNLVALAAFCVTASARAGEPATRGVNALPYVRYAPASAKLFITTNRLADADEALARAHAWRLLPMLSGTAVRGETQADLRSIVRRFLRFQDPADIEALMRSEIAVVARSWSELAGAVWLVRVPDRTVLDHWFPPSTRMAREQAGRVFRTKNGTTVCVRDGVAAIARHDADGSLFRQVAELISGGPGDPLAQSAAFRELASHLPPGHVAVVSLAKDDRPPESPQPDPTSWWPVVDRAVIGLYEGEGRIDVAIRASVAAAGNKSKLKRAALDRLFQLPRTTLFALAMTVDFEQAYRAAAENPPAGVVGRYLALLSLIRAHPDSGEERRPKLGPHVILVWGQDLREGSSTPQVAVMVECHDGPAIRSQARQAAERIIKLVGSINPDAAPGSLNVRESRHLGVAIWRVPLEDYTAKSRRTMAKLLSRTEPAWTVWNGWLILALSSDHIERILDAQFGLAPVLATVPDVQAIRKPLGDRSILCLVQADLATDVLNRWLNAYDAGQPSLLAPVWWQRPKHVARIRGSQLGIGMKVVHEPGVVVVANVYPGTVADGRLQPEDRIIGIDGKLLPLTSPNAALRRGWLEDTPRERHTLRILRDGAAMDVVLAKKKTEIKLAKPQMSPADAVRELASLGRTLQFVSFAVLVPDNSHYSARLSLRFAPGRVSSTSTGR